MALPRTRKSLFYLAGYLLGGGVALIVAPTAFTRLLLSNGDYEPAVLRLLGALLFALGALITSMIRHSAEALYPGTLIVRPVIIATMVWGWFATKDPLFLVLTGIVGIGWVSTLVSYLKDRAELSARG